MTQGPLDLWAQVNFLDEYIPYIKKYSKAIIALDRDATTKSFDIANQIGYYIPTEVKILKDDLKYFKPDEIKEMLCKRKDYQD